MRRVFTELKPDFLIVHNMFSIAYNLPASSALLKLIQQFNLPTEAIHHDFWWERAIFNSKIPFVKNLMNEILPPRAPQIVSHIVINSLAKHELMRRKSINAKIFGDLFDFEPLRAHTKEELKQMLNLKDEIVFLQATRIVRRKAIEVAIDFVHKFKELSNKNAVLVLANSPEKYIDSDYLAILREYAQKQKVKLIEAFSAVQDINFMEFYKIAHFVLYPTIWEGFGNQLLEAIYYKVLPVLFEYEVFRKDLKSEGYEYISLGSEYTLCNGLVKVPEHVLENAAGETLSYLNNRAKYERAVENNFKIALRKHSPKALEQHYAELFSNLSQTSAIVSV